MRIRDDMPSLDGATMWLNSEEVKNEELLNDKPILVHFWSVSCRQCKTSMVQINQIRDNYKGRLHVIAVHMPRSEKDLDIEEVKSNAETYDITQPIYVDNDDVLTNLFSNRYVPAYYLFDRLGKLRLFQAGELRMKLLENRVRRIIEG